ncbi:MAG: TonB-dependent receptor [Bacteroides sp.]
MKKGNLWMFSPQQLKKHLAYLLAVSMVCMIPISAFAQVLKVSLKKNNVSMQVALQEIEKQSGYTLFYNDNQVKLSKKVSIDLKDASVETALQQVFKGSGYSYRIVENQIVVSTIAQTNAKTSTASPQQKKAVQVSGTVKDTSGEPIIGASIIEKGVSSNGTITDINGNFKLTVSGNELQVSYIGYTPVQIVVKQGVAVYNIVMKEDAKTLDEVVVVGYSSQRKESLTGSMQTLKSDKLKDITSPSVTNMLNGKAPGVFVAPGSGQPGAEAAIVIRGKSTINGSTDPLWVIDGVIVGSGAGALNPADVETMTILKDAASTAIYGSQGANGVILVTTRSAKAEKMTVTASVKAGISNLNNGNLEVMNGAELYDYYKSFANAEEIAFPRWNEDLRNSNFSWWDLATGTGVTQDYNVSLSGGNEKLKSFLSIGVYDETGSVRGYDYTRYNFRYKTTYKMGNWLTVKPSMSGSRRDIDDKQYSTTAMYSMFPWDSPFDENGKIVGHRSNTWVNSNSTNYLYDLQWDKSASTTYEFMGNLDFDVRFTDWLTFSSINNYKWQGYSSSSYTDPRSSGASGVNGRLNEYQSNMVRRYTNQILRFNKMFGKHSVNALLAYEFNDYWSKTLDATGTGFVPGFEVLDVTALPEKTKGGISEWAVQSYLFNANYAYDNKYMAQVSFRRDGASNFGTNAKYGNFFSVSGGWNIHKESFFHADWVNVLKVRASYGSVGNRPTSLYPQYDLYSVSQKYNGISGALISQIGNKDLTWEKTMTTGLGLDATLFNRLRLSFDYYIKNTSNLLYPVPVSGLTGVTVLWRNVGELKNTGAEFTLGADIIQTKDWNWSIDFNIGTNNNEVKKLYGETIDGKLPQIIGGDVLNIAGSADKLLRPGLDSDSFYLKEWAGVNAETGAPEWYKTVKQSDGTTTREKTSEYAKADQVVCGASTPDFFGGFSTALSYKNIDFNANFGYSVGGKIYNYSRSEYDSDGAYTDRNQMKLAKGWSRWQKPGDIATHPVARYNNSTNSNKVSSRYLENGDFLKLRSVSIGYNLALPQYFIQNLRLFVSGENLFCITDYSGVDPEVTPIDGKTTGSVGPGVYPSARKFMFGLNVTF